MQVKVPFQAIRSLKGNSLLLPLYAAVTCGVRKAMDDWVPLAALPEYQRLMRSLGLFVVEDCIFQEIEENRQIQGSELAPTTRAQGLPMEDISGASPSSTVHVFISNEKEKAEAALNAGWYPVAIPGSRVLPRPGVDALRLGDAFGYPRCCTESFMQWNDWKTRSHLSHSFKSGTTISWVMNCLTRQTPCMTIFHVPCRHDCPQTSLMSEAVLEAVKRSDDSYAARIKNAMRGVFLALNEGAIFKLHEATFPGDQQLEFERAENMFPRHLAGERIETMLRSPGRKRLQIHGAMIVVSSNGQEYFHEAGNGKEHFVEEQNRTTWFEDPFLAIFE
jgi:hypothetical protein